MRRANSPLINVASPHATGPECVLREFEDGGAGAITHLNDAFCCSTPRNYFLKEHASDRLRINVEVTSYLDQ